jgi:hypothetical protein
VDSTWSTASSAAQTPASLSNAESRESLRDTPRNEFGGAGLVYPDRLKEIETADEKETSSVASEQSSAAREVKESPGAPPLPPSRRGSSVVPSRPGSASSNQGFRGHSVGPTFAPPAVSSSIAPTPLIPAPSASKVPPTGPKALNSARGGFRNRVRGFRGGFAPSIVKRETDEDGGLPAFRSGRGMGRVLDRGGARGRGRGSLNSERAPSRESISGGDFEMVDAKAVVEQVKDDGAKEDVEMVDAPKLHETVVAPKLDEKPTTEVPVPPAGDAMDEEDEDVLTREDVIAKIDDINEEVQRLEAKLKSLATQKSEHLSAIEKEEQEQQAEPQPAVPAEGPPEDIRMTAEEQQSNGIATPAFSRTVSPSATGTPASPSVSEAGSVETESDESLKDLIASKRAGDLPYLQTGPQPKPAELDFFQANLVENESVKDLILSRLSSHKKGILDKANQLKRKYEELYEEWSQQCQELDKESTRKKKGVSEPTDTAPIIAAAVAVETVTRRRGGNVAVTDVVRSEAEMEQVLKELMEQDAADDARAKQEGPKEADLPDMILDEKERLLFKDNNRLLRSTEEILVTYNYKRPPDNFSSEEHQAFCDLYAQYPKQWHKISAGLKGRTYGECIAHYYMSKKQVSYKDLVNKGKKRRTKSRRAAAPAKTRQSALLADLGKGKGGGAAGNGEDDDADMEDVTPAPITERGRPKRAAAPTFGQEPKEDAGKGGKDDDQAEKEKGGKRARAVNNGRGKRVRTPATGTAAPTPVPSLPSTPLAQPLLAPIAEKKSVKPKEDLRERESDAASALAGLSGGAENVPPAVPPAVPSSAVVPELQAPPPALIQPSPTHIAPQHVPQAPPTGRAVSSTPKKERDKSERPPGSATSSYWSVPEQGEFPGHLEAYGTNWSAIAQRFPTKTTVMVCSKFVNRRQENMN